MILPSASTQLENGHINEVWDPLSGIQLRMAAELGIAWFNTKPIDQYSPNTYTPENGRPGGIRRRR